MDFVRIQITKINIGSAMGLFFLGKSLAALAFVTRISSLDDSDLLQLRTFQKLKFVSEGWH